MALLLVLLALCHLSQASSLLNVHRMAQYDSMNLTYGSRSSEVNFMLATASTPSITRRMVVLHWTEVQSAAALRQLVIDRAAGAVLVVLPESFDAQAEETIQRWTEIERELFTQGEIAAPVLFCFETAALKEIQESLNLETGPFATAYQGIVAGGTADVKKLKDIKLSNLQGLLKGEGSSKNLPTLAVIAHYDTYTLAPSLRGAGVRSNGSGVASLLALARAFARLYAEQGARPSSNLLFVLTAAGPVDFEGTLQWLSSVDSLLLTNLDYALCLDSLGDANELYLHVSRQPKENGPVATFYQRLADTAAAAGVHFEIVLNKLSDDIAWEHEHFVRRKIPAGTLSSVKVNTAAPIARGSIFDQLSRFNSTHLLNHIRIIGDTLARHLYNFNSSAAIFAQTDINAQYVDSWLEYLATTPRGTPFLSSIQLPKVLDTELSSSVDVVEKVSFRLKTDKITLYVEPENGMTLEISRTKPVAVDIAMSVAVLAYLLLVYVALVGVDGVQKTIKSFL